MKRFFVYALVLLGLSGLVEAAKPGRANLFVRQVGTENRTPTVQVGDVLHVELFLEGRNEEITGVALYLEFDDRYLRLIPAATTPLRPFTAGTYLRGVVAANNTMDDVIGNSMANNVPLFQLFYNEDIPGTGNSQRVAVGNGVVATFRLEVISKPPEGGTNINLRPIFGGSESGYFVRGDPGSVYSFNTFNTLSVRIQGLQLKLNLPDLYLLPGQIDESLLLDDYVDDPIHPDDTLVWTAATPVPDSIQVSISPTRRVVVDPHLIEGDDRIPFIGIARVQLTATTRFDESVSQEIRVIVSTPPGFVRAAIPDTVRFWEDRDTTFVLQAQDPDPGAILAFSPVDTLANIFAFMESQSTSADTVQQVVRLSASPDYFGTGLMRFRVQDQFGMSDTVSVRVIVLPVNDPPRFIKPFPEMSVDAVGQVTLDLREYVEDIDDPFDRLRFSFTGVDSIAFHVTSGNQQLIITPVRPFQGVRTANVVVADTSNAVAIQQIVVRVLPPTDPQPPKVTAPFLKVGVRAGAQATAIELDPLVNDLDTPKDRLVWTRGPVSLVQVDANALSNRQLQVSAPADSTGFRRMTLRVTDPTQLYDTLAVRIYASSVVTGVPVAGGLPNLTLLVGQSDTLNLRDYYFDANHADDQMTWTATGQSDVEVTIDPATHRAVLRPKEGSTNPFEDITFTVSDPEGNSATASMRVTILDPGSVLLDMSVIGGRRNILVSTFDTLALAQLVRVGNANNLAWQVTSRNPTMVVTQLEAATRRLILFGARVGSAYVVLTATDQTSNKSATDSLLVEVRQPAQVDTLVVQNIGPLTLTSGRDTTLNLSALVVLGTPSNLAWSTPGNDHIGVEIDTLNQRAILRPRQGFLGNAGALLFQVQDVVTNKTATSIASPIQVVQGVEVGGSDLLRVSVVANPVLKKFLNVFVRARRPLLSRPFLEVRLGEGPAVVGEPIVVDAVGSVADMWVGNVRVSNDVTGTVVLAATGITQDSRVALSDTLRLRIEHATLRSVFSMSHGDVSVSLPAGGVTAPSAVALIPERREAVRSKPVADGFQPISDAYLVYATDAEVQRAGEIAFAMRETVEGAGIYRWDEGTSAWIWVGSQWRNGWLVGQFEAFGRYGAFVDLHRAPAPALHQNFPNPFNPQTTIRFEMPNAGDIRMGIYNALGQTVRTLITGYVPAGQHVVVWDARDDFGQQVGAGIYLYRLEMDGRAITRKMMLLK